MAAGGGSLTRTAGLVPGVGLPAGLARPALVCSARGTRLRGNKQLTLEAVSKRGHAFQYASAKLRSDRKAAADAPRPQSCS